MARQNTHRCTNVRFNKQENVFGLTVGIQHQGNIQDLFLLFDTGATSVTISPDVFRTLGIQQHAVKPMTTAQGIIHVPIGFVDEIVIDGVVRIPNVLVASQKLPDPRIVGLLGGSLLKHVGVYMNMEHRVLRFYY